MDDTDPIGKLSLPPGFRFYPTDEELLVQYLCRKVAGHEFSLRIIGDTDLYKFDPWVLPSKAVFGEKEWYFFSPRDRKYPNGSRPNRVAGCGYWKATGTDKVICSRGSKVGIKKALVFYMGKAPLGTKTNWIMHEYRLFDSPRSNCASKLDDWVLCRIYKKTSSGGGGCATAKEHSPGGSSASSYLDEVLETSPEGISQQENNDPKVVLDHYGSVSLDWSVLARLTAGSDFGAIGPNQAPCHQGDYIITNGSGACLLEDDVEIGLGRNQRVSDLPGGLFNPNPNRMWAHSYLNSADPFGIRYPVAAFGSRQ